MQFPSWALLIGLVIVSSFVNAEQQMQVMNEGE